MSTTELPCWVEAGHEFIVPTTLLDDPEIKWLAIAVYAGLARHVDAQTGLTDASQIRLAAYTGVGRKQVRAALEKLEAYGAPELNAGRSTDCYAIVDFNHLSVQEKGPQ